MNSATEILAACLQPVADSVCMMTIVMFIIGIIALAIINGCKKAWRFFFGE